MFVSIDIGGTNTRLVSTEIIDVNSIQNSLGAVTKFSTPQKREELLEKIYGYLDSISQLSGISVGVAGPVDQLEKRLLKGTNIPALSDGLSARIFEQKYKVPVALNNDGVLAGLAEAVIGEGKEYHAVAYVTISTGVGGALIINKQIQQTRFNPEIGHHIIEVGGQEGRSTHIQGEWEAYSSGPAFKTLYGIDPEKCSDLEIWKKYAQDLAIGLHNITILWAPEIIILGGGLSAKSDYFLDPLKKYLDESLHNVLPTPEIKISKLGDLNGMLGGMLLAGFNTVMSHS